MVKIIAILISLVLAIITSLLITTSLWAIPLTIGFTLAYVFGLVVLFFLIAFILSIPINNKKDYKNYSKFYSKYYLLCNQLVIKLFGVKVNVKGEELLPNSNIIVISNHRSNCDSFCMDWSLRKYNMIYMAKKSLFKIPFFGSIIHRLGYLKAERDNPRADSRMIADGIYKLKNKNISIGVFPEGTRNLENKEVQEFKHGVFHMAMKSKKPIVIACMDGTQDIKNKLLLKKHIVTLHFIKTMCYDDYKDMSIIEFSEYCRGLIIEELNTINKETCA